MPIALGFFLLIAIFLTYKLLITGWLYKIILFFAGWIGLFIVLYPLGMSSITLSGSPVPWSFIVATGVCFLALLTTKVEN